MYKLLFGIFLSLACLLGQRGGYAQAQQKNREATLQQATEYLHQIKLRQLLDSVHLQELRLEIQTVPEKDTSTRQKLQNQINKKNQNLAYIQKARAGKIDSLKKVVKGYPVVPFHDTLFYVYHPAGRVSTEIRAQRLQFHIKAIAESSYFLPDSLHWVHHAPNYTLTYADKIIFTFTDDDALWYMAHRQVVIEGLRKSIVKAIQQHRQKNSFRRNLSEISMGFLLLTGLVVNVLIINLFFGWLHKRVFSYRRKYKGFKLGSYQMFDRRRQVIFILFILRIIRLTSIVLSVYWIATYSFSIFPATAGLSKTVWEYTLTPLKHAGKSIIEYIPNLFFVLVILILMQYFLRFIDFFATEIERNKLVIKGFYAEWARPTFNIFRTLCYIFGFILIFPYLPGSSSPVFQTVSAFLGLLLSLGSSSAVSNMVAGIVITYMRSFKIGDRIRVGDTTGDVIEKNLLITRIKTMKDEVVTIPNANLLASNTLNFSASNPFIIHTSVTIGYNAPWRTVHELLIRAALKTQGVCAEPKPFVLQTDLNDFYVGYEINAYIYKAKRMLETYSELHQNIQDEFNKAGVEIMSPHYTAWRDGNDTTVVPTDKF
jgi:small-conductance mechanosensitive channel